MIHINHPDTVKYLADALKDESEYSRRAAVEVLNEIGNVNSVKDLLDVLKDDDWWVRSRAGDALAEIGGPKVVDSVVALINDEDEEIRRTAIEILNATKDERAVDHLIKATDDSDWWVRERAVDALSKIGSPKALPKFSKRCSARTRRPTRSSSARSPSSATTSTSPMIVPMLNEPGARTAGRGDQGDLETRRRIARRHRAQRAAENQAVRRTHDHQYRGQGAQGPRCPLLRDHAGGERTRREDRRPDAHAAARRQGPGETARPAGQVPDGRRIAGRHDGRRRGTASGCADASTSRSSSPATSSTVATSTSKKSARAHSVPCC